MANGWTDARRARMSAMIREWKPWTRSTGPKTLAGKAKVSKNGYRGGFREVVRDAARELNRAIATLENEK
ncbi:hypothetical protein AB4037_14050 [Labrys sp. KB_33_2]|uniref:hypothetical protein n=1 Tax=Labrys sp. KB_33_2 TaxID=3237479 RepID=UPI003F8F61E2